MTTGRRRLKWIGIGICGAVFYLLTALPVGMALYAIKVDLGWNVFRRSGYHAFSSCVAKELSLVSAEERGRLER